MPATKDPIVSTDRLMNKRDVAELIGVQVRTLERYIASRQFPAPMRVGGSPHCLRWRKSAVDRYLSKLAAECGQG